MIVLSLWKFYKEVKDNLDEKLLKNYFLYFKMNEEAVIWHIKKMVLQEKLDFLCENLMPCPHIPFLRSKYCLSGDDEEVIASKVTRREKVHKLLNILLSKGPFSFDHLCDSIQQEKTQIFILEALNKHYEQKVNMLKKTQNEKIHLDDCKVDDQNLPTPSEHKNMVNKGDSDA